MGQSAPRLLQETLVATIELRELTPAQVANAGRALAIVDDQIKQAKQLVEKHVPGASHEATMAMTTALVQALSTAYAGHASAPVGARV
jgi:hypothetical protein